MRILPRPSRRSGETDDVTYEPALVVTGISRSGTSYLCNLLHRFDNCVAVNEPREVISLLREEEVPNGVPAFYAELRRRVASGKRIENKLLGGEVVEDTARYQVRHKYRPRVASPDFVLAVKNTREFLLRLEAVRSVMPAARVVACIRDPADTIASWKASFPHLRAADVSPFTHHRTQMWLPDDQRAALARIEATSEPAKRRAKWWVFLAERVLEHRAVTTLVRYDELATRPDAVLTRVLDGYRPGDLQRPVEPSPPRSRRNDLDADDLEAIREHCAARATELGL
jgi:Sulfotransferase family